MEKASTKSKTWINLLYSNWEKPVIKLCCDARQQKYKVYELRKPERETRVKLENQGQKELLPSFFAYERRELKVVGPTYLVSLSPISLMYQTQWFWSFSPISLVGISLSPNSLLPNTVLKIETNTSN